MASNPYNTYTSNFKGTVSRQQEEKIMENFEPTWECLPKMLHWLHCRGYVSIESESAGSNTQWMVYFNTTGNTFTAGTTKATIPEAIYDLISLVVDRYVINFKYIVRK